MTTKSLQHLVALAPTITTKTLREREGEKKKQYKPLISDV